jgi:ABC-type oligopeptide transport system substrate-binding subunit
MWGPRPYLPQPKPTVDVLTRQLGEIGIQVEVVSTTDSLDYGRRADAGDYDMVLSGWMADTPDAYDFLAATLHSHSIPVPGRPNASANNMCRYASARMDELLERYRKAGSPEVLDAVMQQLADDIPLCPLFYGPSIVVHSWRLREVELSNVGIPQLAEAQLD